MNDNDFAKSNCSHSNDKQLTTTRYVYYLNMNSLRKDQQIS